MSWRLAVDALVALALLAASAVEIWGGDPAGNGWGGPPAVASALALLAAGSVVARVRRPLEAATVALAAGVALVALAAPRQAPFEPAVALVLTFYSVAAHARLRPAAVLLAAASVAAVAAAVGGAQPAGDVVPALVWVVMAWAAGAVVGARARRARELEDLAAQLVEERDERARAAVAGERARIAREMHDVIAHNLSVMVVHAGAASRLLEGEQPIVRDALATLETVGRETVDELRRLLGFLRREEEDTLTPPPGLAHLDALVAQVRAAGLEVDLQLAGERNGLPAGVDLAAYRIVQEALTNALKHAGRARARVAVRYAPDALELEVVDDGAGDGDGAGTGHGLVGMRERVALYDGELAAGARPEGGYAVRARLPYHRGARA